MIEENSGQSRNSNAKEPVKAGRRGAIAPSMRPSESRKTESVFRPCSICGSSSWDTDEIRGETSCSVCGYVAEENTASPTESQHSWGDWRVCWDELSVDAVMLGRFRADPRLHRLPAPSATAIRLAMWRLRVRRQPVERVYLLQARGRSDVHEPRLCAI